MVITSHETGSPIKTQTHAEIKTRLWKKNGHKMKCFVFTTNLEMIRTSQDVANFLTHRCVSSTNWCFQPRVLDVFETSSKKLAAL